MEEIRTNKRKKKVLGTRKDYCACGCGGEMADQEYDYDGARSEDGPEYCACSCGPLVDRDSLLEGPWES